MINLPKNKEPYSSLNDFENQGQFGGSYKYLMELKDNLNLKDAEIKHIPEVNQYANSLVKRGLVSNLKEAANIAPAIIMTREDYKKTVTANDTHLAKLFKTKQKNFIESGDFLAAIQMDINDIHSVVKPKEKYDEQIDSMLKYVDELIAKGIIIQKGKSHK